MPNISSEESVSKFLTNFKTKKKIFGLIFRDDRGKNLQTLLTLELSSLQRDSIISNLEVEDYIEGPNEDTLNKSTDLWIFGKNIKKKDVYIKITMGIPNSTTICISFHLAEKTLAYPFKKKKSK